MSESQWSNRGRGENKKKAENFYHGSVRVSSRFPLSPSASVYETSNALCNLTSLLPTYAFAHRRLINRQYTSILSVQFHSNTI